MKKQNSRQLIAYLLKSHSVIAPVEKDDEIKLQAVRSADDVSFSLRLPVNSFKQFLLPHYETIFDYTKKTPAKNEIPLAIFGIAVVDLKALILFDQVFASDPNYQKRRQAAVIIGQGTAPEDRKFLEIFEENVLEHLKFDIFIDRNSKGKTKLFTGSPRGQKILNGAGLTDFEHIDYRGTEEGGKLDAKSQKLKEKMINVVNDKKFWEGFAKDCLLCGKCTVVCPTCYCFDLDDESGEIAKKQEGRKIRRLSSCFYEDFASIAGGENFLKTKAERLRNYYIHKFIRVPERQNLLGCVGCLRCFKACPVGIDIRKILAAAIKT